MQIKLTRIAQKKTADLEIVLFKEASKISDKKLKALINQGIKKDQKYFLFSTGDKASLYIQLNFDSKKAHSLEKCRLAGSEAFDTVMKLRAKTVSISNNWNESFLIAFTEGLMLSAYQFLKYKKEAKKLKHPFTEILLKTTEITKASIEELKHVVTAVYHARNLVNEPLSFLTAVQLAKSLKQIHSKLNVKVEIFNKKKIESLKMGGLLAVNKGSVDPPSFTVLTYKPKNAVNKKPLVFVGKGVVYDTGGLSLKPTANSMDHMKCDMGGAAAVGCATYAIAAAKLPVYTITLVPATDNRPGGNAYAPGDVITMHSGSTVEVLNTDAEGRMLLADALHFAKQFKPMLVIDAATLTGAALRSIGQQGVCMMGTADEKMKSLVREAGYHVHERVAELPFWDEYEDMLKSDIADIKNIGGAFAGAITAGKFLQHFTDYPWLHFDIAAMGWMYQRDGYRLKNGSGVGVRLFYKVAKMIAKSKK